MNNTIQYKGYTGSIEYSKKDNIFYGKVSGIRDLVSYEGNTVDELTKDFHEAVDNYIKSTVIR